MEATVVGAVVLFLFVFTPTTSALTCYVCGNMSSITGVKGNGADSCKDPYFPVYRSHCEKSDPPGPLAPGETYACAKLILKGLFVQGGISRDCIKLKKGESPGGCRYKDQVIKIDKGGKSVTVGQTKVCTCTKNWCNTAPRTATEMRGLLLPLLLLALTVS